MLWRCMLNDTVRYNLRRAVQFEGRKTFSTKFTNFKDINVNPGRILLQLKKMNYASIAKAGTKVSECAFGFRRFTLVTAFAGVLATAAYMCEKEVHEYESKYIYENDSNLFYPEGGSPILVGLYLALPFRYLSRAVGNLCSTTLPIKLRAPIYKTYSYIFGCDLSEIEKSLDEYETFSGFFSRRLKPGCRYVNSEYVLLSPSDGTIVNVGIATLDKVEQIKGVDYTINALIGSTDDMKKFNERIKIPVESHSVDREIAKIENIKNKKVFFCVIYLAPYNYHRFHSPTEWSVHLSRHFYGNLYTVSPKRIELILNKFITHERVALLGEWKYGLFSMIPVGSTNVGSIKINFDEDISTNIDFTNMLEKYGSGPAYRCYHPDSVKLNSGDEIGYFSLGSTIVLIFEAPSDFSFSVKPGQNVHYGQPLSLYK